MGPGAAVHGDSPKGTSRVSFSLYCFDLGTPLFRSSRTSDLWNTFWVALLGSVSIKGRCPTTCEKEEGDVFTILKSSNTKSPPKFHSRDKPSFAFSNSDPDDGDEEFLGSQQSQIHELLCHSIISTLSISL